MKLRENLSHSLRVLIFPFIQEQERKSTAELQLQFVENVKDIEGKKSNVKLPVTIKESNNGLVRQKLLQPSFSSSTSFPSSNQNKKILNSKMLIPNK